MHAEKHGRLRLAATRFRQRLFDDLALGFAHRFVKAAAALLRHGGGLLEKGFRQVFGQNLIACSHDHGAFNRVFQLAHIAWPFIAHQHRQGCP